MIFFCVFAIYPFLHVPFWRVTRLRRGYLYCETPSFQPLPKHSTYCSWTRPASSAPRQITSLCNLFRINTCKSLSKQTTSTTFRIIDLRKMYGEGRVLWLTNWQLTAASKLGSLARSPLTRPSHCSGRLPVQQCLRRRKSFPTPGNNSALPGV